MLAWRIWAQADVGVGPHVVADIMAAMRGYADENPTEYDGAPFVQVGTLSQAPRPAGRPCGPGSAGAGTDAI